MNTLIEQEMPVFENIPAAIKTANKQGHVDGIEAAQEVLNIDYSYFQFKFEFQQTLNVPYEELTDEEIITLADNAGTFDFLNDPEEDIYSPSDGVPYEKR